MNSFDENVVIHDKKVELYILSTFIYDPKEIDTYISEIIPTDFYDSRHIELYKLMLELFQKDIVFDQISLLSYIVQKNKLSAIGGEEYYKTICSYGITTVKLESHIKILKELSMRRSIVNVMRETSDTAIKGHIDTTDIIDKLEQNINSINMRKGINNIINITELVYNTLPQLTDKNKTNEVVETGFEDFDNILLGGLHKSDLIILAARPGMGKTAFALNIALNVVKKGAKALLFTLEMSNEQLFERLLAMESLLPLNIIRQKTFNTKQQADLVFAAEKLSQSDLYIGDTSTVTINDIKQMARKKKREDGLDIIIVDYLQLIVHTGSTVVREQQVSEVSRSLKILAKELNIPILALAQLSRGVEARADSRPNLSDIRESGSIEQDADLVLFLYREGYYDSSFATTQNQITELLIKKHRHGSQGTAYLNFIPEYQKFNTVDQNIIDEYKRNVEENRKKKAIIS